MRELGPGEAVTDALTLLRGFEGALFPAPGLYQSRLRCGGMSRESKPLCAAARL